MRTQTKQFDTFDNAADRKELFILFERLGEGHQTPNAVRAEFLRSLLPASVTGLADAPMEVNPDRCHPSGALLLFTAIVGVLGVPIWDAAKKLDEVVRKRLWAKEV